eukprot:483974-Alexandrium_andersonii.AAC.1
MKRRVERWRLAKRRRSDMVTDPQVGSAFHSSRSLPRRARLRRSRMYLQAWHRKNSTVQQWPCNPTH